jgi:hypothetical protein
LAEEEEIVATKVGAVLSVASGFSAKLPVAGAKHFDRLCGHYMLIQRVRLPGA